MNDTLLKKKALIRSVFHEFFILLQEKNKCGIFFARVVSSIAEDPLMYNFRSQCYL